MKKFLAFLVVVIIIFTAAVAVFIATFNLDKYRPLIVEKIQAAVGKPVSLGALSLSWRGGLAVEAKDFAIEPSVHLSRAAVVLKLMPLLHKEIQIASVVLTAPKVVVEKSSGGAMMAGGGAQTPSAGGKSAPFSSVSIHSIRIENGEIDYNDASSATPLKISISNLDANLAVQADKLDIHSLSADFAKGKIKLKGAVDHLSSEVSSSAHLSAQELSMEEFLPHAPNAPGFSGRLSVDFEGHASGAQWPQIAPTLSGQGRLTLKDGVLLNVNVLRQVLEKISAVPGIGETITSNIPQEYRAKLDEPNTILGPIDWPVTVQDGRINFQNLSLATDIFLVSGSGQLGLDKTISASGILTVHPNLSAALIQSAPPLRFLVNPQGELSIPLRIEGLLPHVTVIPDTQYVSQRIASNAAQEVVSGLIQGKSGKDVLKSLLQGTNQ